jgi:hypothetical protein
MIDDMLPLEPGPDTAPVEKDCGHYRQEEKRRQYE